MLRQVPNPRRKPDLSKMKAFFVILTLAVFYFQLRANAQAEGEEESERVQYTLILPDEKTPEMVKPEENNPFEAVAEGRIENEGDTEENQVRDQLLRMRVGGAVSGPRGMRVMLGEMRLEPGMDVPSVLPDQQVILRVKTVTANAIELVWVEKKPTGLPPKLLVIPIDGTPTVRYRMPTGKDGQQGGGGNMGTLRRPDVSAFAPPNEDAEPTVAKAEPVNKQPETRPEPAAKTVPPPSNVPEASVLRMLFGNHAPTAK